MNNPDFSNPDFPNPDFSNLDFSNLEKHTAEFVTNLYNSRELPHYPYHNLKHTSGVVTHAREIAAHYKLDDANTFVLVVAAWGHDIGHLYGPMAGHEERGVTIMQEHLTGLTAEYQLAIGECIMATKLPSHPENLVQKIICDADTFHLGTTYFLQTDPLVRGEVEMRTGKIIRDWRQRTLDMLRQHVFFTDYCQTLLKDGKARNIAWVEAELKG